MNAEIERLRADYIERSNRRERRLKLTLAAAWIITIGATVLMVLA